MTYRYMKNNNLGASLSSYYIFAASLEASDNNEPLARTILEDVLSIGNDDSFQDAAPSMPQSELSKISKALNEIEEVRNKTSFLSRLHNCSSFPARIVTYLVPPPLPRLASFPLRSSPSPPPSRAPK